MINNYVAMSWRNQGLYPRDGLRLRLLAIKDAIAIRGTKEEHRL